MPERGKKHPVADLVRGYSVVAVASEWEQGLPFIVLRLTYRHPSSRDERRLEFRIPVDQQPTPKDAFRS